MTQFYTRITFFRLTFQRDILDKLLVNGLHRKEFMAQPIDYSLILRYYLRENE